MADIAEALTLKRRWVALLVSLAVVGRLIMMGRVEYPIAGDEAWYPQLASNLLAGHGLWLARPAPNVPFDWPAGWFDVRAMYPPLYPIVLAAVASVFGINVPTYTGLNIALDLCSAGTLWLIGRRLGREDVGAIAAVLFLLYPTLITWAPLAQKESLALLLCSQLLLGFARKSAVHVGIAAGLLALAQPALAPLAGCLGLGFVRRWGWAPVLRFGLKAAGVAALVMAPWWIRNYLLFGAFVPLTTSFGLSLKVAVEDGYNSLPAALLPLTEPQRFSAAGREAWMVVVSDPLRFAGQRALNAFKMLTTETRWELTLCYWGYVVAAIMGWARRAPAFLKIAAVAVLVEPLVFTAWLEFDVRHRVYLIVPMALLGGWWLAGIRSETGRDLLRTRWAQ